MRTTNEGLEASLKQYTGFDSFRQGQREIIEKVLAGRNVLGLLATGGGKSLTYQLPSLMLPMITLVVTPLISLMIDQVQQLKTKGRHDVTYLNSSLPPAEIKQVTSEIQQGKYKLIYISPEKLQQPQIVSILKKRGVSLVAIDEAHCISQWGHDFRTDYLRLPKIITALDHPPVLAVTATATEAVQQELCKLFQIASEDKVILTLNRTNIAYEIKAVESEQVRMKELIALINRWTGPGIVYCSTRQSVEQIVQACHAVGNIRVHGYHGGMSAMDRILIQEQFLRDELSVIIATNAFGMGIDKANIRYVVHYHYPSSIEAYVQEVGRIGRDGRPGYACLFYLPDDFYIHHRLMQNEVPTLVEVEQFITLLQTRTDEQGEAEIPIIELQAWLGLSETAQRMLFYYGEKSGLIRQFTQTRRGFHVHIALNIVASKVASQITSKLEEVKKAKTAKLRSMQKWLEQTTCLREGLQAYFGESLLEKQDQCCAICGLDDSRFSEGTVDEVPISEEVWDFAASLQKLFPGVSLGAREADGLE